jgi:CheY-like chemotaxis protein
MLTTTARTGAGVTREQGPQIVVIVNGNAEIIELVERVLGAGRYDLVFAESSGRAYSQIKRLRPNLVVLRVRMDDPNSFQVLSMLKLDADTRDIAVLTYTAQYEGQAPGEEEAEPEIPAPRPRRSMN